MCWYERLPFYFFYSAFYSICYHATTYISSKYSPRSLEQSTEGTQKCNIDLAKRLNEGLLDMATDAMSFKEIQFLVKISMVILTTYLFLN
jgi:hypothetical protein